MVFQYAPKAYESISNLLTYIHSRATNNNVIFDEDINRLVSVIFEAKKDLLQEHVPDLNRVKQIICLFDPKLPNEKELLDRMDVIIQPLLIPTLKNIPPELRLHIFSSLSLTDLNRVSRVCHQFAPECRDELFRKMVNEGNILATYNILESIFKQIIAKHPTKSYDFSSDHPVCQELASYMDYFCKHSTFEMQSQLWTCIPLRQERLFRALLSSLPKNLTKLMLSYDARVLGNNHNMLQAFFKKTAVFKSLGQYPFTCLKEFHLNIGVIKKINPLTTIGALVPLFINLEKFSFHERLDGKGWHSSIFNTCFTNLRSLSLSLYGHKNEWESVLIYFLNKAKKLTSLHASFAVNSFDTVHVFPFLAQHAKHLQVVELERIDLANEEAILEFLQEMPHIQTLTLKHVPSHVEQLREALKFQGFNLIFSDEGDDAPNFFEIKRQNSNKRKLEESNDNSNSAPKQPRT